MRPDLYDTDNLATPRSYLAHGHTPARFYVDSLVHDKEALKLLLKLFGVARVALGSDYPFPLGESHPGKVIQSLKLTAKEKTRLFSGNACDFLGINP